MKIKSKALLLVLCAVLLVTASGLGTMAYLTDDDSATNTFTVGSVGLTLDETDVDNDTNKADNVTVNGVVRDKANKYHLLPGHTYTKDPTVTVDKNSEDAYVRMIVNVERIDQLKAALPDDGNTAKYYAADGTFLLQMLCNGWDNNVWAFEKFTQAEGSTTGVYEFRFVGNDAEHPDNGIVVKNENDNTPLPALFKSITVPGELDNTHLAYLKDVKIVVVAHAIQADGFANADAAWTAFGA